MGSSIIILFFCFMLLQSFTIFAIDDRSVLLQFKNSLSDHQGLLSSWTLKKPNHCSWFGILCDSNNRILSINISGEGYKGNSMSPSCSNLAQFPLYGFGIRRTCKGNNGKLVGALSPVISKLSELRVLSLPYNELSGEIPGAIWGMEKLEILDLEGNLVTGSLPVHFSGLRYLRVLNLGLNRIKGEIPESISNCDGLEVLNLAGNQVNGTIPEFVTKLNQLKGIYLSFNQLGGLVPRDIGKYCGKLEHLDLSGNFLVGRIPNSLGNCGQLRTLLLYSNMLEDAIPTELGMLHNLQVLDVSRNSLSGSIPHELGNCSELSVLVLSNLFDPLPINSDIKGESSPESRDEYNYLQGNVPVEITLLPKLRLLWAPRATLEGEFPENWGTCESLAMINLAQNFFSGKIPEAFAQCKKLHFLDLNSNRLTGEISKVLPVPCLTMFDVSGNRLSGSIPKFDEKSICPQVPSFNGYLFETDNPSSAYLSFFTLETLAPFFGEDDKFTVIHNFEGNNLTGILSTMPIAADRLGKQTAYALLAGKNMITGKFPGILFEKCDGLKSLFVNISDNNISGQIPLTINKMCRSLKLLDASGNQINGWIPDSIGDMGSIVALNLSRNFLQGQIPAHIGQLKNLKFLSLAVNNFNGSIPSSLGQLLDLELLDLSSNSLSGHIPREFSNLKKLTALLLNNNNLSGQIPSGLANVKMLSLFNVSFNNLSGPLPLNGDLMKCNSVLGNPFLRSCRIFSLTVPYSDSQGRTSDSSLNITDSPSETTTPRNGAKGFNSIEIASITSSSAIVAVLLALVLLYFYTKRWDPKSKIRESMKKEVTVFTDIGVQLTFENVVRTTGSFNASNCIGNGGFGATYKAEISPGVIVAIKRLSVGRFQGVQQFDAEIKTLGRLRHPNLVTLIGYHASESEMFLIYNFLSGGNLEKFIQERSTTAVDWRILHKIALDIARALAYLHDQCVPRVLHRDVKPSNILLDEDFNAYLSDFGLARLLGTSETHATTGVAGTFGYVAPEYAMTCRVSDKADVYSYGVVLLELLSDKKVLDPSFSPYGNGFNIVAWACMLLRQGRAKEFFTAGLWDSGPHDDLVEVLHLAVMGTVDSLSTRPTMRQVVRRLKQLQPPSC